MSEKKVKRADPRASAAATPPIQRAQRELTAYHEAGHAVVTIVQGSWIREGGVVVHSAGAHVDPLTGTELLGCVSAKDRVFSGVLPAMYQAAEAAQLPGLWAYWVEQAAADIRELLAGPLAELIAQGVVLRGEVGDGRIHSGDWDDHGDFGRINAILMELASTDATFDDADLMLRWQRQTARILRRTAVWRAVEAVAAEVLVRGTVSGDDVERIVTQCRVRRMPIGRHAIVGIERLSRDERRNRRGP